MTNRGTEDDVITIDSHKLQRLHTGSGIESTIQPTCSCGWVGIGYAAWNDYQHTMVKDQESDHLRSVSCKTL